jgi:hypothetical protein
MIEDLAAKSEATDKDAFVTELIHDNLPCEVINMNHWLD